jgi:hypothetical protein
MNIFGWIEIHPPALRTNLDGSQTFVNHTIYRNQFGDTIKDEYRDGLTFSYK